MYVLDDASYFQGLPIQAVYCILDTGGDDEPYNAGWIYVGSSDDCHRRKREHDRDLRRGRHHCKFLQDCSRGIDGKRWRFIVLEEVEDFFALRQREAWWRSRAVKCFDVEDRVIREGLL
jgi:hypothetical protein